MPIIAGVDFGTLNVRVSLVDSDAGRLDTAVAEYPLHRRRDDPHFATQSHADQMSALVEAMHAVLRRTGVSGDNVAALALDTTGSSVVMVDKKLQPLDDYYLWCDHRAYQEAREITETAHALRIEAIEWCGGAYSHEWGWAKLLHWLRHADAESRAKFATALEHCDMVAATLTGASSPLDLKRSVCAMGHKWMWNPKWGGFPPEEFFSAVDPLLKGVRGKIKGEFVASDHIYGKLTAEWAEQLELRAGTVIPVGALDAHWDAIGAGCKPGDVVNVVGTSTCIIAMAPEVKLVPGVCGVVPGSVHPSFTGIEAGLSAVGDIFEAIARRGGKTVRDLAAGLEEYQPGQTGLLRLAWDNGDRTVLVNPDLGGMTIGWNLMHTAQDELFSAIEGTAFHTRIILERMAEYGVPVRRVINAGGIPQNNQTINQIYANVFGKTILVPQKPPTSLGSAIFAFVAAKVFPSIEAAQEKLCPSFTAYEPEPVQVALYEQLYQLYRKIYFAFGTMGADAVPVGDVLPELRRIARQAAICRYKQGLLV